MLKGTAPKASRYAAIFIAVGAVVLGAYLLLRNGSNASARGAPSSAKPHRSPTTESADDVERPATSRPRPRRSTASARARDSAEPDRDSKEAPPLEATDAASPAVKAVLAARDDRSSAGTRALIASLTSPDAVVVAEATRALIERDATEAIGPLARIDLGKAAGGGLSIIDALGRLGGIASDADRTVAVDRLVEMLAEEKRRGARESPGNLLQIYEALGLTGDPSAAAPLEAELLDPRVPRAPKVVIVASLVKLGQPSSHRALETQLGVERAAHESDAFEEDIRKELVGAIEDALKVL